MELMKKKFDTSASLKENGTEVILQGTFHEKIKDFLVHELKLK